VARRKSVAKREGEFIDKLLKLSSFGLFVVTFLITNSFQFSLSVGLAGFFLSVAFLIYRKVHYLKKLKRSEIADVDQMSGIQFEKYLKLIFEQKGFKAEITKTTGDFGADLILKENDKKIVVQAKRYNSRVGIKAVQEAVSAVQYYKATEAWVVTNNEFTSAAIELARSNKVRLIERDELIHMASDLKDDAPTKIVKTAKVQEVKTEIKQICKRCGGDMIRRSGKRGEFHGCANFPKCRYTETIV